MPDLLDPPAVTTSHTGVALATLAGAAQNMESACSRPASRPTRTVLNNTARSRFAVSMDFDVGGPFSGGAARGDRTNA